MSVTTRRLLAGLAATALLVALGALGTALCDRASFVFAGKLGLVSSETPGQYVRMAEEWLPMVNPDVGYGHFFASGKELSGVSFGKFRRCSLDQEIHFATVPPHRLPEHLRTITKDKSYKSLNYPWGHLVIIRSETDTHGRSYHYGYVLEKQLIVTFTHKEALDDIVEINTDDRK